MAGTFIMSRLVDEANPALAIREAAEKSQEELARELGVSVATWRKWEYDGRMPKNQLVREKFLQMAKRAGFEV